MVLGQEVGDRDGRVRGGERGHVLAAPQRDGGGVAVAVARVRVRDRLAVDLQRVVDEASDQARARIL